MDPVEATDPGFATTKKLERARYDRAKMNRFLSSTVFISTVLLIGCSSQNSANNESVSSKPITATNNSPASATSSNSSINSPTEEKGTTFTASHQSPVTEQDLGVPFYPGSKPEPGSDMKLKSADDMNIMSIRTTDDDPDKVGKFYQDIVKKSFSTRKQTSQGVRVNVDGTMPSGAKFSLIALKRTGKVTEVNVAVTTHIKK